MATGIISTGGIAARPYGFKTRARRGRIISAGSPYHAVRSPTGTFLGVLKVAPADRARRRRGHRAARRRSSRRGPRPSGRRSSRSRTQHWHRMLALASIDRAARGAGAAARGARRASRCRRRTPPSSSAGARGARRRHRAAAGRARPRRRAGRRVAPALAVLGAAAVAGGARPRGARADPRARRGPRAAELGGQGLGRLLHDVLRLDRTRSTSRAGAARLGTDPEPGHD